MLRVVAHKSAAAAQQYYAQGLKREDYYTEGQEIAGKWYGKAAELLGLSGKVMPKDFAALVNNRHPVTGDRLTPHTKSDRIVGYDLNFHAPKSLSILYAFTNDEAILTAFRKAVSDTMAELETRAATRVRKGGVHENRVTGNLAWSEFVHFTARPVGGIPDPHLHVHCFTFNATFDEVEDKWKAAKFREIKKEAPYGEAYFHSRLTMELAAMGYVIERTRKGWEIKGMPSSAIAKFSRRTAQIDQMAHDRGITDPKMKDLLGAASREGKRKGMSHADLLAAWGARLTDEEKVQISKVCYDKDQKPSKRITAKEALDYACGKCFANDSVVRKNTVLAAAMRYGVGHTTPEAIQAAFAERGMIVRQIGEDTLCTSFEVLAEEIALIQKVRAGRGKHLPLATKPFELAAHLSDEQKAAVRHIMESKDQVVMVRGAAGVGKTTAMKEAVPLIEQTGKRVFAFAPSADASRDTLREAGFPNAETVAHLLVNARLQLQIRGQVIWIDEAATLGVRDLLRVMEVAGEGAKVLLTGDVAQHAPVDRGDGMRLLQKRAGLRIAEITEIRRQVRQDYKQAVSALSRGDIPNAFRKLDEMGAILEIADAKERYSQLASDYLALRKGDRYPLVISPTHAEGAVVTEAIREAKRAAGQIGEDREFIQFHDLKWAAVDRALPENYHEGLVVQFHHAPKGIMRGQPYRVTGHDEHGKVQIESLDGKKAILPLRTPSSFQVFEERRIKLAPGDQIRMTRGSETTDGKRINNGNSFRIDKITDKGEIVLHTGSRLAATHGHFTHGYCQTSHTSQSKSIRDVLIAQSERSFVASSREQIYVSGSRGIESITIYTDSRQGLEEAVGYSSSRMAGVELANFSKKELSTLMSEMDGKKWQDWVQTHRGRGETKSFFENLLHERRQDSLKKEATQGWAQYIETKRGMAGPDGKSRSKGHPTPGKSRQTTTSAAPIKTDIPEDIQKKIEAVKAKNKVDLERQISKEAFRANLGSRSNAGSSDDKLNKSASNRSPETKKQTERSFKMGKRTMDREEVNRKSFDHAAERKNRQAKNVASQKTQTKVKVQAPPPPRRGK